jgi:hypothetical protein
MTLNLRTHAIALLMGCGLGLIFGTCVAAGRFIAPVERFFHTLAAPLSSLMPAGNSDQDFNTLSIPITCALLGALLALALSLALALKTRRR